MMPDLEFDLLAAAAELPWSAWRALLGMGADRPFAASLHGAGDLGVGMVSLSGDGALWAPEGPDRRLLLGVREGGELVDVLALSSTCRDEWAARTGQARLLGFDQWEEASRAVLADRRARLRVHATPFDWLAAGGNGICVLDWTAEALGMLRGLGERATLAVDPGAKERMKGLLAWGGLPQVEAVQIGREMAA